MLVDLAFGVEDWVSDAALFALVAHAYWKPERRSETRDLVRARLVAAAEADRPVTIAESLAHLMLVTPGCRPADQALAMSVGARATAAEPAPKRRWWQRKR